METIMIFAQSENEYKTLSEGNQENNRNSLYIFWVYKNIFQN